VVHLNQALNIGESTGAFGDLADVCRNLALAFSALERHTEAVAHADRALELARAEGGRIYLPMVTAAATEVCERAHGAGVALAAAALAARIVVELSERQDEDAESQRTRLLRLSVGA
jgi:hypothetical protein